MCIRYFNHTADPITIQSNTDKIRSVVGKARNRLEDRDPFRVGGIGCIVVGDEFVAFHGIRMAYHRLIVPLEYSYELFKETVLTEPTQCIDSDMCWVCRTELRVSTKNIIACTHTGYCRYRSHSHHGESVCRACLFRDAIVGVLRDAIVGV